MDQSAFLQHCSQETPPFRLSIAPDNAVQLNALRSAIITAHDSTKGGDLVGGDVIYGINKKRFPKTLKQDAAVAKICDAAAEVEVGRGGGPEWLRWFVAGYFSFFFVSFVSSGFCLSPFWPFLCMTGSKAQHHIFQNQRKNKAGRQVRLAVRRWFHLQGALKKKMTDPYVDLLNFRGTNQPQNIIFPEICFSTFLGVSR
jgi:hypothetical protein